jgi:hypothetical protein
MLAWSATAHRSAEMQLRDLRDLASRGDFELVGEYCDEGVTGARSGPRDRENYR